MLYFGTPRVGSPQSGAHRNPRQVERTPTAWFSGILLKPEGVQDTLGKLAASLAATEDSLAEARAETRRLDDAVAAAEMAATAAQQTIQVVTLACLPGPCRRHTRPKPDLRTLCMPDKLRSCDY